MLSTWNALAKILRLPFAWGVTAVRIARVSYSREQREQAKKQFFFLFETTIDAVLSANSGQSTSRWGEKQTMNVGGGVKIETDETKKVHRYVHSDGRMPNCVLNTRDLQTVV